MAKQLNVSLAFTANTNEAIAAIKQLQKELNGLATGTSLKNSGISELTPEIQKAMVAAGELQAKLESATNLKTGKLDLSQFSDSLKKGGVSLQEYANQLNALGPAGRQAFTNLAQSIIQAEAPLIRCSKRLKEFGTTLANTARWQISSSMLHGFLGTLQSAYGYAQNLNKSLNDIRIVTGSNIAEMEQFAKMANKAARELSTTTNEYAKASLIYFQQGDSQEDVMKKAAVTTKMANVTGQSAEVVSNQLTAIWNNFNKAGEQSYERYADILTKLGAATASSTDEIAGGLEKFAGIADQIGLSYEYAASALATITATSRESEDVVGTALKTIFARIQGLNLGETLDDGTTLNKYSQALEKVGISIFDQAGELKDMDDILEEMADTWGTLNKDQQTALAQTVAGVRQYNQLMTLMNNWDVMDNNLAISFSADGELDKQAEIYAESWEAARDRVQASAEAIYTKILDDDFFIAFLDGFANVIDGISGTIDAFGGLKGILLTIGAIASRLFHDEMVKGLKNAAYNLKQLTPLGKKEQDATREQALSALRQMKSGATGAEGQAENSALTREVEMQEALMRNAKKLTDEELKQLQVQMDLVRSLDKRAVAAAKAADVAKQELDHMRDMNKIQAQMDAKIKARTNAKSKGEDSFTDRAFKAAESGGRKTMVEQYYKKQKHAAEDKVRQAHGLDAGASLDGFEDEVRTAFVNGIREAAKADGASEIAQKVGKELEHSVSTAMSGAAKKMSEAMANARREVEAYDQQIDKAAKANATAKSLGSTAKNMSAYTGTGDDKAAKSAKELAALQETLKNKIMQTKQAAEQLAGSLGDEDMDIQLNDDIKELDSMERQLEEATLSAEELEDVLRRLNSVAESGDYSGMTIGERIQNAADVSGTQAEMEGTTNTQGENIDFSGHYDAAKKKAEADIVADTSGKDAGTQKEMFDEKVGNSGGVKSWADGIANATSIVMGLGSAITSVQGAIDVFNNPDASNWDKFSAVMSVIIGLLPVMSTLFTTAGTAGTAAGAGMTAAMGPVGWIILAVVAAVAALTAAFIALSNAYNRDAINAKKAAENAEKLAEASDKAKSQLEGIKNGFDAYDTAVEKLKNCVKGTDEWNEALKEVNDTVLGLMKSYPELLSQKNLFTRDTNGMLVIDEKKREGIIEEAERQANVAEAASLVGSARASEAMVVSQNTSLQRNIGTTYSYDSDGYVDARVDAGKIMTENKDKLAGLTPEEFEEELRNLIVKPAGMLDSEYDSMITRLVGYQSSIDSLVTATENAATQMDNATLMLANQVLGDDYGATETAAAAQAYEEEQDRIYDEIIKKDAQNNAQIDGQTQTAIDIWDRFQAATGITHELADNAIQGDDNNRVYAYVDETGKEQTYTIEYIAQTIAASEAMAAMGTAAEDAAKLLGELSVEGTAFAAALGSGTDKASMANFMSGMTQEEIDAIGKEITVDENGNATISDAGLEALGVTREQFEQLAATFGISVQDLTNNLSGAYEQVNTTLSDNDKRYFENANIDTSGMTIGEQQKFIDNRDNFNKHFTDAGTYSDSYDIIRENADLDPTAISDFMSEVSGINLTAEGAGEQIAELAEKYGIQGESVEALIGRVNELDQTYNVSTQKIAEQAASLKSIVGEGLNEGDNIEAEDLKVLEDAGINVDQYFTQMADGTYSLTGDAEEFNNVVKSITLDQLKEQVADFNRAKEQALEGKSDYYREHLTDGSYVGGDNLGKTRLDYINSFESGTFDFSDEQNQLLADYTANPEMELTAEQLEMIAEMIDTVNAKSVEMEAQMFSTATSLSELNQMAAEMGSYSLSAYGEGLINLASKYDNCEDEIQDLQEAMMSGDEAMIQSKIDALELATAIGELSAKYGLDAEDVETHARLIQKNAKGMKLSAEQAANLAVANRRMNKGVATLNENWKDWSKILKSSNKNTADYADTLNDAHEALADLVGAVDAGSIPLDFLDSSTESGAQHLEWMEKAAQGDAQAINQLGVALTAAQVELMEFDATMAQTAINGGHLDSAFDLTAFNTYKSEVLEGITALQTAIQNGTVTAGQNITGLMNGTGASWVESLNAMAMATGMSVEEMNAMLNQLGVQAKVDVVDVEQKMKVPTYTEVSEPVPVTVYETDGAGNSTPVRKYGWRKYTIPGPSMEVDGVVQVAQISTEDGNVGAPQISYTGTSGGAVGGGISPSSTGSTGGGGGGSSNNPETAEKREPTKKSDTVERYREVSDAIDNVTDALTRAERATDRLWGKDKLNAMREQNKELQKKRDLLLEQARQAEEYAKQDAADLRKVADDIGVSVVIDQETGDITNIEDVESTLHDRLAAAEAEYNAKVDAYNKAVAKAKADGTVTDEENDKLEKMKDALDAYENDVIGDIEKDIEAWEEAEQQFQDSIETWEDAGLEAEEVLDQIMQNNYDIIMEGLEIPLSLNEEDLRLIELQLSQIEDDVYSMAEAVALTSSQFGEYQDNLRLADEALAELNRAHEAGEITDAAYQEGLGEIRDKYYENVEALMELDNTMMEYYSNTIDMANEELSKYTDQIEHQTSVLEHYSSLIELMGKSSDYKMMGKVLEGQVKTTKDAMTVSKQWYETQRANADSLAAEYAAAQARGASDEELELIKANWDAAEASANEAQDKMLSDAEAWAEALKAVLENKLADLGQTLENALTGGTSFETINTQMERAQSLQEEYLTTTNQIYETNKLMRTAQQEIDKTTNSVAKKKLQAYIAETEQLQNQSKLSQYELDIQKAKYDLLLAEIALEEAQDAKSTVRLQRDSEGNFGYVYTADQNKLAEAQQQLEDAQNNLYNIGLEGANDYAQKYQQTMQEMYDTFADLQQQKLDGAFETEEEYHRAMEEAKAYYYQKLQDYSGLYSVAVTTDSRVVADAWSSDFADMVYDTDEWMSAVDQYVADVELAFKEWSDAVHDPSTGITAIVGGDVAAVGETVQGVTDKSAELAKTTTEKVIPALDDELDAVQNMTGAYANMRKEIQAVIEEYTNMINRINNSQTNEWNNGDSGNGGDTGGGDEGGSGDGNTGDGGGSGNGSGGDETKTDSYRYGTVEFRGNGADRIWIDEAGKQYAYNSSQGKALQTAFNKAFERNGGYKGDYWIGWTDTGGKLKADILREKDGLRTGGYTGEWAGSYGKLALLHQKELVLNAQDTENLLTSMEVLNKIVEMIDLQSMSSQLGGMLNSPSLGLHSNEVLEQNVHIEASFPGVQDRNEIEEAFNNLINKASQFANRK